MAADFDDFVRRQQARREAARQFDVPRALEEWRASLARLYEAIAGHMADYLEDGRATIARENIELNEEFSGPYQVEQLALTIGSSVIVFRPVGTMLIGAKGRVEVQGPHGGARLVLVDRTVTAAGQLVRSAIAVNGVPVTAAGPLRDKPIEWVWKWALLAPDTRLVELTNATFFELILSVADA